MAVLSRGLFAQCKIDLISSMLSSASPSWRELDSRMALNTSSFTFAGSFNAYVS